MTTKRKMTAAPSVFVTVRYEDGSVWSYGIPPGSSLVIRNPISWPGKPGVRYVQPKKRKRKASR